MFGMGWGELLIVLVIVLAVFGAGRLANIGNVLGTSIREFRKAVNDDPAPTARTNDTVSTVSTVSDATPKERSIS